MSHLHDDPFRAEIGRFIRNTALDGNRYRLTRFIFLRMIGLVYFVAFLALANQVIPLIGANGLLPAQQYLEFVRTPSDSPLSTFFRFPSLFLFSLSDAFLQNMAWVGVALSALVLAGFANAPVMFILWLVYLSYVHIGQVWYGYGWEMLLLETGFLSIFLCPLWDMRPFPRSAPPPPVIWLLRWLVFRVYLGAGLIKLRGDDCWSDLTCLYNHFETQPIPNPLSRYFHFAPRWALRMETLWNHFIELIVPFFVFHPRRARIVAGLLLISFQGLLILSGNLSFLNYLTIAPAIACFDDGFLRRALPGWIIRRSDASAKDTPFHPRQAVTSWLVLVMVALLSAPVVANLMSSRQLMNTTFNPFYLVNTYGAFGSVGRERHELILEGTDEETVTDQTVWQEYGFKAKPGDPQRRPPIISPYHYRVDWQIWFAAMQTPSENPWLLHLIWKLLANDPDALSLLDGNPFPNDPPRHIRVSIFHYRFAELDDPGGAWWKRTYIGEWLPPLSRSTPEFQKYIDAFGWKN